MELSGEIQAIMTRISVRMRRERDVSGFVSEVSNYGAERGEKREKEIKTVIIERER